MCVITDKKIIIYSMILFLIGSISIVPTAGATSILALNKSTLAVTKDHIGYISIQTALLHGSKIDIDTLHIGKNIHNPVWSPDGQRLAYIKNDQLYIMNKDGSDRRLLTYAKVYKESDPVWSPDGLRIAFVRKTNDNERSAVYAVRASGWQETNISGWSDEYNYRAPSWSPNSAMLLYEKYTDTSASLVIETLKTGKEATLTDLSEVTASSEASWSPSGKKILYKDSSNETYTIWPDGSHRTVISDGDSYQASWSRSGDRIVFIEDPSDDHISISEQDGTVLWLPIQKGEYSELAYPSWSPAADKITFTMIKNEGGVRRSDLFVVDLKGDRTQPRLLIKNVLGRVSWQ